MNLLTHLFFVASLAALSLAACTGESECASEQCSADSYTDDKSDTQADDGPNLIRMEIEVVGTGMVVFDDPNSDGSDAVSCTSDQGLCSFSYARGTTLAVYAEGGFDGTAGWEDACQGQDFCTIVLDSDQVLVANFDDDSVDHEVRLSETLAHE